MIYFISDTHFNHTNIIKYCNRPFKDINEMNETIIKNWNELVTNDDIVYHLGDIAFGIKEDAIDIISLLNGKKYIVRGNHDKWNVNFYESCGLTILRNPPIKLEKYKLLLSHVPVSDKLIPKDYINLHGHIHNKNLYECIENYLPSEYSLEKHINISCDVTNFKPISIEDILSKVRMME